MMMDLYNIIAANGRLVAAGLPVAPEANVNDGLLDAVLVPKRPAAEMALVIAEMLLGKHLAGVRSFAAEQKKSLSGRCRGCGSMRMANWSEMSRLFSKFFLAR
jgi:diacylglycerol kinase family enzyme